MMTSSKGFRGCVPLHSAPTPVHAPTQGEPVYVNYSTCSRPPHTRLDWWNELIGGIFPGMTVSADRAISADWTHLSLGKIVVARARSERAEVRRWDSSAPVDPPGRIVVHLQHVGSSVTEQRGRAASLGRGDMTLCSSDEPYRIGISDRNQMLVVDCPASVLSGCSVDPDDYLARPLGRHLRPVGLLHDYLNSLLHQHWMAAPDAEEAEALGSVIATLLRRCLHATSSPSGTAMASTRERVLHFIEQHLFDNGLRTRVIADSLSISVRSVQMVFAELATTPTAFVLDRRLVAAAEAIKTRPGFGSVADLAFEVGFCDASYFARKFKARFGVSPSRYTGSGDQRV